MDNNQTCYHDKVVLSQNIDRIRYYDNKHLGINVIAAGYDLNTKTSQKNGGLFFFKLDKANKTISLINNQTMIFDYGLLDVKFSKAQLIFSANSDYSYSITNINTKHTDKYPITSSSSNDITCNILYLYSTDNEENESKLFLGTNDGKYHIIDIEKHSLINSIKAHDYGLFSLYQYDNNTFITGSEDRLMKLWDIRAPEKAININKKHKESINSVLKLSFDLNVIITGSYSPQLLFIDMRQFDSLIKEIDTLHNTWDIIETHYKSKHILAMSCIYEGINLYSLSSTLEINNMISIPISKENENSHQSIVYGIDIEANELEDRLDLLTCSFYDSKVIYWSYKC